MTRTQQLRALHPDTNGGDHSRVAEFTALVERLRNVCRCGCKSPLRYGRTRFLDSLHYQLHRRGLTAQRMIGAFLLMLLGGCSTAKPAAKTAPLPKIPVRRVVSAHGSVATGQATVRMAGCQWDAPPNFNPLTESFEVWTTTNLSLPFFLRTNTTATVDLRPMVEQEYFKVRTVNSSGEVSDWATTRGH